MPPPSLLLPSSPLFPPSISSPQTLTLTPIPTPRRLHPRLLLAAHARRPPAAAAATGGSADAAAESLLPIARCYEGNLARLELAGTARREQAIAAAAAAVGGEAAEGHLAAGVDAMIVEAFVPGGDGERGIASTRMILQAKDVKQKANKLRKSFGADLFSGNKSVSENTLAMTIRQVVMEQVSNVRLDVFSPGSERDFQDLSKPRKVSVDFTIRSSDERFLSALAEAICSCALEDTGRNYLGSMGGWFHKQQRSCSVNSSICVYRISERELARNARRHLENFNLLKSSYGVGKTKHRWWPPPNYGRLAKIEGPEFVLWANEFVPAYRLQVDANAFENTKLDGCHELTEHRWEVLLTHFQLVELGDILDMYFEDQFTLKGKVLHSNLISELSNIKRNNSSLNKFFVVLAGSCVILFVGVVAQVCWPQSIKVKKSSAESSYVSSSESYCSDVQSLDDTELQAYCVSVVKKLKDSVSWPGDIMADANIGAWVGELPDYFKGMNPEKGADSGDYQHPIFVSQENQPPVEPPLNMASFQVVISEEGKIVGFQPTSRVAVNHWATNPLATILYGGRKLSPGFLEPRLKISRPNKVVPIELLMSVNTESFFALARPVREPC